MDQRVYDPEHLNGETESESIHTGDERKVTDDCSDDFALLRWEDDGGATLPGDK